MAPNARIRWLAWGIAALCVSCSPAAPGGPGQGPSVAPAAPAAAATASSAAPAPEPTAGAALCGMRLKNPRGARLGPAAEAAEPVVHVSGELSSFEIDNHGSTERQACTFLVAGPAVRPETVFFGYGSLRAPAGRVEAVAAGRVRVTYPIPGGTHGLISIEPPVEPPADPHRFSRGALAFELEGAAVLRADRSVPYLRSLGPAGLVAVHNGGAAAAAVEFVVDNVSPRLAEPSLTGLSGGLVARVAPLTLRIKGQLAPGERARLRLAPRPVRHPFAFVFGGDVRNNTAAFTRLLREAIRQHDPLFVVTMGDYTDNSLPHELDAYVRAIRDIPVPVYPVLGNHELHTQGLKHYARLFGPKRYAFTVGDVAMVVLDSNDTGRKGFRIGAEQLRWLEQTLEQHRDVPRKMVALHAPPHPLHAPSPWAFYPANLDEEDASLLTELARRYQVAYVLSGHVHLYARGEEHGTVYLTSGGGGARLAKGVPIPGFDLVSEHHVMVLEVRKDRIDEHRIKLPATE